MIILKVKFILKSKTFKILYYMLAAETIKTVQCHMACSPQRYASVYKKLMSNKTPKSPVLVLFHHSELHKEVISKYM